MAECQTQEPGLERVLGTGALFATAYGNVGSSIYYALGLVAVFALGMTPVVFVIAGLIFAATAATYAEATTMFPEAGGSSSLRPPRLQRVLVLLRGVGPDAHLHHHRRHLGVLRAALPGGLLGAARRVAGRHRSAGSWWWCCSGAVNIVGVKESAGVNIFFAIADFLTQVAARDRGLRAGARPGPAGATTWTSAPRPPSATS